MCISVATAYTIVLGLSGLRISKETSRVRGGTGLIEEKKENREVFGNHSKAGRFS